MVVVGPQAPLVAYLAYLGDMQQCKCMNFRKIVHDAFKGIHDEHKIS